MGPADAFPVDEAVGDRSTPAVGIGEQRAGWGSRYQVIVLAIAILIFFGCAVSPPSLMDDVDAVQAQIARNMLDSGDWVTARLDGVPIWKNRR